MLKQTKIAILKILLFYLLFQKNVITLRSIISLINLFWERWALPHQNSDITYFQAFSGKGLVHLP
jgi:hypothetical protein